MGSGIIVSSYQKAPPGQGRRLFWYQGNANVDIMRVAAQSRTSSVAGAIAGVVRDYGRAEVQAIGAGAVNQALKAVITARDYLALDGIDVVCIPVFIELSIDGLERTAIRLVVEPRSLASDDSSVM